MKTKFYLNFDHFQNQIQISHETFIDALFNSTEVIRDQYRLQIRHKESQIDLVKNKKLALNDVYLKFAVSEDKVTCSPLKCGNQFI